MMTSEAECRILLVEDFRMLRLAWEQALLRAGYECAESVETSKEALIRQGKKPYDLIIIDVTLSPDDLFANGCIAGSEIAKRWPETKVVFTSGHGDDVYAMKLCPPGAPLITKGIGPQQFLAKVAEALTRPPWKPPT